MREYSKEKCRNDGKHSWNATASYASYIWVISCIVSVPLILASDEWSGEYDWCISPYFYLKDENYKSEKIYGYVDGPNYSYNISTKEKFVPKGKKYLIDKINYKTEGYNMENVDISIIDNSGLKIGKIKSNGIELNKPHKLIELHKQHEDIYIIKNETIYDIWRYVSINRLDNSSLIIKTADYEINKFKGEFKYQFNNTGFWSIASNDSGVEIQIIPNQSKILNQECPIYFIVDKLNKNSMDSIYFKPHYIKFRTSDNDIFVGDINCIDDNVIVANKSIVYNNLNQSIILYFDANGPEGCHTFEADIYHKMGFKLYDISNHTDIELIEQNETRIKFNIYIDNSTNNLILADLTKPTFDNKNLPKYWNISYLNPIGNPDRILFLNISDDVDHIEDIWYQVDGYETFINKINISKFNNKITKEINEFYDGDYSIFFKAQDKSGNIIGEHGECVWKFHKDTIRPEIKSTNPNNNGLTNSRINEISVEFNEDMEIDSLWRTKLTISYEYGDVIIGPKNPSTIYNNSISFIINYNLENGTAYRATIIKSARDKAGNELANDYSWKFKTDPEHAMPEEPEPEKNVTEESEPEKNVTEEPVPEESLTEEPVLEHPPSKDIYPVDVYPNTVNGARILSGEPKSLSSKDNDLLVIKTTPSENTLVFEFLEDISNYQYNDIIIHIDCDISHPDKVYLIDFKTPDNYYKLGSIDPMHNISKDITIGRNQFKHCIEENKIKIKWEVSHQGIRDTNIPDEFTISIDQFFVKII